MFRRSTDGMFASNSYANWRFGWVAGVGGEMRLFNSNWLGRLEYLHYDFGRSDTTVVPMLLRLGHGRAPAAISPPTSFAPGCPTSSIRIGSRSVTPASEGGAAPVRYAKAPLAPLPWTWAGFYLGAHGGYGWADDPFNKTLRVEAGAALPAAVGRQFPRLCRGLPCRRELAVAFGGRRSRARYLRHRHQGLDQQQRPARLRVTQTDKLDPVGSVRARLGYLVTPDVLIYGTGGLGWTQFSTANDYAPGFVPGVAAGAKLAVRLGRRRAVSRSGSATPTGSAASNICITTSATSGSFTQLTPAGVVATESASSGHLTADVARAGLSYKLNWPDPAGAGSRTMHDFAKAPVAQPWSWSGFYLGGHGGYGWGDDRSTQRVVPSILFHPPQPAARHPRRREVAKVTSRASRPALLAVKCVRGGLEIDLLPKTGIKGLALAAGDDGGGGRHFRGSGRKSSICSVRCGRALAIWSGRILLLYGKRRPGLDANLEHSVTNTNPAGTTITETPSWRTGWTGRRRRSIAVVEQQLDRPS